MTGRPVGAPVVALLFGVLLVVLTGCVVSVDRDRPAEPTEASAFSTVDGVETWDLTGKASDASFGIEDGSSSAIYETPGEPRRVRIVLPGRSIETEAVLVDFYRGATGDYSFGVRTAELKPEPLTEAFRDVLRQLEVDEAPADTFAREVAAAPEDQSERISVGADPVELGQWSVGPAAGIAPLAGSGRVIFSGTWDQP